jgi:hypothetical protein
MQVKTSYASIGKGTIGKFEEARTGFVALDLLIWILI